jgi:diamine N-acetyltransferase
MVRLIEITRENWIPACFLRLDRSQYHYQRSSTVALASLSFITEHRCVGIESEGKVVGLMIYELRNEEFWLHDILVDIESQGKGIGRAALLLMMEVVRTQTQCQRYMLNCVAENAVALALYHSLGFQTVDADPQGFLTLALLIQRDHQHSDDVQVTFTGSLHLGTSE